MDNRFLPWFELQFTPMPEDGNAAALVPSLAFPSPINRNYYEADLQVHMRFGLEEANRFELTIAGLSGPLIKAIEACKTSVTISLGYSDGTVEPVLEGVIQKKDTKVGNCFYETTLTGIEKAFYSLQNKCLSNGDVPYRKSVTFGDLVDAISIAAEVPLHLERGAAAPDTQISGRWSFELQSALHALRKVYEPLREIGGYALTLRDGKVWYGRAGAIRNNAGLPPSMEYSFDNYLVKAQPTNENRGGERGVCSQVECDASPLGYDFEMLGDPRLRPGDSVFFRLKDENGQEYSEPVTIESITHNFSRTEGYRCTGKALRAEDFLETFFRARAPGAGAVSEEIDNLRARNQERYPAVNVGDVTDYTPEKHTANARLGLRTEPTMISPSVQLPSGAEGFTLEGRPMVAPFAWNLCGLVVPVYPGMRAVAVHNRFVREDALLNGFVWTEEMEPPPNEAGDYWLSLPLNVRSDQDQAPNNSNKAANDLTTGDGKRVIQLKGLRIAIGEGLLENLGTRPTKLGADNELQIELSPQTKITMKDGEIKMEAGGRTMTIASGKVSVS